MVVRIQNGSVLLRNQSVATSSGCCCGQCPPGQVQCGPDCCTQEQTCCSGECCDTVCCNGVCCLPGETCNSGVCSIACATSGATGCNFTGCYWYIGCGTPGTTCSNFNTRISRGRQDAFPLQESFDNFQTQSCDTRITREKLPGPAILGFTSVNQYIIGFADPNNAITEGVRWKSGYPQRLTNCIYNVVVDVSSSNCSYLIPASEQQFRCRFDSQFYDVYTPVSSSMVFSRKVRVLVVVDCAGTVADITDLAIEGGGGGRACYQSVSITREKVTCECTPKYTCECASPSNPPLDEFFDDPVWLCPP